MFWELKTLKNIMKTEGFFRLFPITWNFIFWVIPKKLGKKFMVTKVFDFKMKLSLTDNGISRALFLMRRREMETYYILEKVLDRPKTVLDLWANIGYYVLVENMFMKWQGNIIAVEPERWNFDLLQENIALNDLKNVETHNLAISNEDGEIDLFLSSQSNVHSIFDGHESGSGKTVKVQTKSITNFMKESQEQIDLIRMDIEWAEVLIFDDIAHNLSSKDNLPDILFEVHGSKYNDDNNIETSLQWLFKIGYTCKYLVYGFLGEAEKLWYQLDKQIPTDGYTRYVYKDLKNDDVISLMYGARAILLSAQ